MFNGGKNDGGNTVRPYVGRVLYSVGWYSERSDIDEEDDCGTLGVDVDIALSARDEDGDITVPPTSNPLDRASRLLKS